jgi:muramoyltetrapeptide carboxypeptidase
MTPRPGGPQPRADGAPVRPRALAPGATFRIVAPSGCLDGEADILRARECLTGLGYRVDFAPRIFDRWKYFAGTDPHRAAEFMEAATDPGVDAVIAARGGYGFTRLLPLLDFDRIAECGKLFVGFSDFTAFHLAALARGPLVTFAGPMAAADLGAPEPDHDMVAQFTAVLSGRPTVVRGESARAPGTAGSVDGTLWGGNLSLVAHLLGTPYFPVVEDGILFVEEVNEQPYQIERMLMALWHAGVLGRQRAILVGGLTGCEPTSRSRVPYTVEDVLEAVAERFQGPVLTGLPFGHIRDKTTLPVGGQARLAWHDARWELAFGDYVRAR